MSAVPGKTPFPLRPDFGRTWQLIAMGKNCVVYGCNVTSANKKGISTQGISTHSFPKDPNVRRKWVNFVKKTRKNFSQPTEHQVICAQHFASDAFADQYTAPLFQRELGYRPKRKLKSDAEPTLMTEETAAALKKLTAAVKTVESADKAEDTRRKRMRKREVVKASIKIFYLLQVTAIQ